MATTYAIPNGAQYMAATLYNGTGATNSIVNSNATPGVSFTPGFVWCKARNLAYSNYSYDVVNGTGTTKCLITNDTAAMGAGAAQANLSSFDTYGFTLASGAYGMNQSGGTFVAWQWAAGGTAVSNTAGSITSQVSANTTSGFSVVTYTGNGSAGATVGHGLGAVPTFMVVKVTNSSNDWMVYSPLIGVSNALFLNLTDAATASSSVWNNTTPTSSVFSLGTNIRVNGNGLTYVGYIWTPVAGYSAFGSYTGNGSTDGTFVYLGFRPRFILSKANGNADWVIHDTSRNPYNVANYSLYPNTSGSEATLESFDILSNGFKIRSTAGNVNNNGTTYIYMAFAENPFKYSTAF